MSAAEWVDDEGDATYCRCHCHGTVTFSDEGFVQSYMNVPPRLDDGKGWAESCQKCEINHWIATSVHNQVVAMEADEIEGANAYVAHIQSKRKA